jgi:hypothetical protein
MSIDSYTSETGVGNFNWTGETGNTCKLLVGKMTRKAKKKGAGVDRKKQEKRVVKTEDGRTYTKAFK